MRFLKNYFMEDGKYHSVMMWLKQLDYKTGTRSSGLRCIWARSCENVSYANVNNKGADQPARTRSLISTFVVHCLDSMICIPVISKISRF